jgi:glycosyltransferase involved in cell wall biosynthesis
LKRRLQPYLPLRFQANPPVLNGLAPAFVPQHSLPSGTDLTAVAISIVIPALNESMTIVEFVHWCQQGILALGVSGQILIVDSSQDNTAQLALAAGAETLSVRKRGLGQAYIDAIPYIRGDFVLMGDADLTYDFREIAPFYREFQKGREFVMGSRFAGSIEKESMPALHRYFGTPVTTFLLNKIYRTSFTDIHCGMRGISRNALKMLHLEAAGWEYASEMIIKAVRLRLSIGEVPVHFFKDRKGRLSHHLRSGWLSPWKAGWSNMRAMFTFAPDLLFVPAGILLFYLGFGGSTLLLGGPVQTPWFVFTLNSLLFSVALSMLGFSLFSGGWVVKLYFNFDPEITRRFYERWTYNRLMAISGILLILGLIPTISLIWQWIAGGFSLHSFAFSNVYGLQLIMLSAQLFSFTLMVQALQRFRY